SKSTSWHAYNTSKPPTHVPMASARTHGSHPPRPPTASHPPTGATAIARPRNIWVHAVYRLASEYQNTTANATGDSQKHSGLKRHAAYPKQTDAMATNTAASRIDIAPRGSSRFDVLGFSASIRASTSRLNPMAALRADTMAARIQPTVSQAIALWRAASTAPA